MKASTSVEEDLAALCLKDEDVHWWSMLACFKST